MSRVFTSFVLFFSSLVLMTFVRMSVIDKEVAKWLCSLPLFASSHLLGKNSPTAVLVGPYFFALYLYIYIYMRACVCVRRLSLFYIY